MMTIAIIGGGFSGTMTAVQLMRKASQPLKVVLIERNERIAKGVAYGTLCPLHLLNVPAKDMSAFPDDSQHFFKWAKEQDAAVTEATFVPRMRYGAYIEHILNDTLSHNATNVEFRRLHGEVKNISLINGGKQGRIELENGEEVIADRVVLALGNLAPANVRIKNPKFYESKNYIRDSWSKEQRQPISHDAPILLIGTGLTMIDKALELKLQGHKGTIYALSRHGYLPNVHIPGIVRLPNPFENGNLPTTVREITKFIRALVKRVEESKEANWRQAVDSIRPVTQQLWKTWSDTERKRFIRHMRCIWDVHRHRIAPEVGAMIDTMIKSGQLKIIAGRVIALEEAASGIKATVKLRGQHKESSFDVNRVINCTGADSNVKTIDEPLVEQLRNSGLLCADVFGLGPTITDNWALIDKDGKSSEVLYVVGPLLKGQLWESIAVPELRGQAAQLADHLITSEEPVLSK
ncbi:MAG: FAD/NAD(P)-binding protein [Candidatus Obscuribacterales bacterium]|nr:FAD/NAD(P)-binding protein [Candidatus Obscuribacterales bacterium]